MKINKITAILFLSLFIGLSYVQHSPSIKLDIQGIHTWRQSQTMWNIRNFVRYDNNILNPRINRFNVGKDNILRYEFPLMQWGIAQLQKLFGEEIAIVRKSVFTIGILSIFTIFFITYLIFNNWLTATFSAILFQYSPVFYYYTINPIPDNLALAFGLIYILFIIKHRKSNRIRHLTISSIALMLSTMCKLPYLMFSIISIFFFIKDVYEAKKISPRLYKYALIQAAILIPAFCWYIWVIPGWVGNPILTGQLNEGFILSEYFYIAKYHLVKMFPHILLSIPIWILLVIGFINLYCKWKNYKWVFALITITFFYLFVEFKPIGVVHDYYMLPFLPWLFIIISFGVDRVNQSRYGYILMIILCIWSSIYTSTKTKNKWSIQYSYFNPDVFTYSENLKNAIPDNEKCIILNDISGYIFSYRIDKMGYVFNNDYLPISWIDDMVKNYDIKYMYSDSRKIDESEQFQDYLDTLILRKGSIKLIKLKIPDDNK